MVNPTYAWFVLPALGGLVLAEASAGAEIRMPIESGIPPGPTCKTIAGPCRTATTVNALFRPAGVPRAPAASDMAVAANFGVLLTPDEGKTWRFVCEETFGRGAIDRILLHPDGRLFAPSSEGLYASSDGCGFATARGSLSGKFIWDVAVDPADPDRVWALSHEPRTLHVSNDGGRTFTERQRFDAKYRVHRLLVAPSDPKRLYVAGYGERVALVMATSRDGGLTFDLDDTGAGFTDARRAIDFLGVHPTRPDTLYVAVADATKGDEIHRSDDAGRSWKKLLDLETSEQKTGFAFGVGDTIYVSGRGTIEIENQPTAHLYVSHDGGETWERRPSGEKGPRYGCLAFDKGTLYACADDEPGRDPFLLGASRDHGETWEARVRLAQIKGAKECVADACAATAVWLCDAHAACNPDQPRPSRPDASVRRSDAGPDANPDEMKVAGSGGCGCRVGHTPRPGTEAAWTLLIGLGVGCARRLRGRTRRPQRAPVAWQGRGVRGGAAPSAANPRRQP